MFLSYPLVNQHSNGKSSFFMGKSTINGHFQLCFIIFIVIDGFKRLVTGPCSSQPLRTIGVAGKGASDEELHEEDDRGIPREPKKMHCTHFFSTKPCCSIIIVYFAKKNGELQLLWLPPLHLRTCVICESFFGSKTLSCWSFLGTQVGPIRRHLPVDFWL